MDAISDATLLFPSLEDDAQMNVKLNGNYFVQTKVIIPNSDNIVNIYVVYMLDPITSTRNTDFTIQNALVDAVNVTKNADISKNKYEGYSLCFDEGGTFSKGNVNNGRNVLIFGVRESSLTHTINKNKNIYVMGDLFVQGINDTTLYAEKVYSQNFTQPHKKFVLSLYYSGNKSYLIVNGKQELAFRAKNDQMQIAKLCLGNLSSSWTTAESQKTGFYGKMYDFVVDYNQATSIGTYYDFHRYLMIKHNIQA